MTAGRRTTVGIWSGISAAILLALTPPALAQNSDAPVDVTAAPAPSADTVGPSQLQNFNLQGTVTRPADRPAEGQPAPTAVTPTRPSPTGSAPGISTAAESGRALATGEPVAAIRPAIGSARQPAAASQLPGLADTATPSLPLEVRTDTAPRTTDSAIPTAASLGGSDGFWSWPWLAALLALAGGGAFIAWSRRGRGQRRADPGRMAFAGLVAEPDAKPVPWPPARPRPDSVPPRAQPSPRPDPVPPAAPQPAAKPVDDGLIKATALKPQLNFQFVPDRAVVTEDEVLLQFDVVLTNSGAAPARDVLVEAKLIPAHAGQDQDIAAFFQQPQATGDRMAGIPPMGKISLKSAVRLPLDQLRSFEVDGRKLFVPLVAFNILYRSSGGEGQASASFLVGRGDDNDEKLAPFRLDLGPRIFRGLSSRPHSLGLQQVA